MHETLNSLPYQFENDNLQIHPTTSGCETHSQFPKRQKNFARKRTNPFVQAANKNLQEVINKQIFPSTSTGEDPSQFPKSHLYFAFSLAQAVIQNFHDKTEENIFPTASTWDVPSQISMSHLNFALNCKTSELTKENIELGRFENSLISRKRSNSDYGSLSSKSIKLEPHDENFVKIICHKDQHKKTITRRRQTSISTNFKLKRNADLSKNIREVVSHCIKNNDIFFGVLWVNSKEMTLEPIEVFYKCEKWELYMEHLYKIKLPLLNQYFNKIFNLSSEQIQEAFEGQSKIILKDLESFNINEYKRSILLSFLLENGCSGNSKFVSYELF